MRANLQVAAAGAFDEGPNGMVALPGALLLVRVVHLIDEEG